MLDLLGKIRRKIVKTIASYQSLHHCNFGKVAFPAISVSTHFIVNSEKMMRHFNVKHFGDVISGRWIPKFICLREGRFICLIFGNKDFKLGKVLFGCMQRAVTAAYFSKAVITDFKCNKIIPVTFTECLTCHRHHEINE